MKKATPVRMSVALRLGYEAQIFTFSRTCTAPRTVQKLSSVRMALLNIKFLVAYADLTCEDLLIGLPVLRHLRIDTKTLLEINLSSLDRIDCEIPEGFYNSKTGGNVSHLMEDRRNKIQKPVPDYEKLNPNRLRGNYSKTLAYKDPFLDR